MPDMKRGDQVRLKRGGPIMTVRHRTQGPEGQELVECVWQAEGTERTDTFVDEDLEHVARR